MKTSWLIKKFCFSPIRRLVYEKYRQLMIFWVCLLLIGIMETTSHNLGGDAANIIIINQATGAKNGSCRLADSNIPAGGCRCSDALREQTNVSFDSCWFY